MKGAYVMNTRQLHYLLTIAERGSLSQAAMALGISQPALSKVLTEWDSLCASPLFLRYHRRQIPTALGRKVLEYAEKIVDEQNRMMLTMRSVTGREKQNIRVCTAPNRGAIIYSKIYNRFSRRYPDISLRLTELYAREQPHAIRRGQVDLALGAGTDSELVTDIPIVREELLVSLPSSHPLAGQKSIRLRDLRDTPFVLQGKRHSIRAIADGLFAEAGFAPVVSFESDDVILLDSMMHQAVGAGLVSKAHVFPCDELVYLSLDPPVYQRLHLRYPLGHTLTEPERYLAGLLIRERLSDPRYEPIRSPEADTLFAMVEAADEAYIAGSNQTRASGASHQDSGFISLDTKILEYLTAIVEEQSLSRAADRFYLAQPALSRHLRNMEETVGLRLFHREHNRLYPTNAGKVFVNNARNILRMEAELDRVIKDYRRDHGGRLFVHCDSTLLSLFAEVVTPAFSSLYPDIQLTVVESCSGTSREALLSSSTDFALFMTCTPKQTELHCEILGLTELVYCADPARPLSGLRGGDPLPSPLEPRSVMLASAGTTLRAEQDRLYEEIFESPPHVVCQAEFALLRRLAVLGGADTILPLHMLPVSEHGHCFSLQPPQPYYLVLAYNPGKTLAPVEKQLYSLIQNTFKGFFWKPDIALS